MSGDLSRFFPGLAGAPAAGPAAPGATDMSQFFNGAQQPEPPVPDPPASSSPFSFHGHQTSQPAPAPEPAAPSPPPAAGADDDDDDDDESSEEEDPFNFPEEPMGVRLPNPYAGGTPDDGWCKYDARLNELENHLEVTPITLYKTPYKAGLGRRIAVNRNYIVYTVKARVRTIRRDDVRKDLLRGHAQQVNDVAFCTASTTQAEDPNLLASASADAVFIWKLLDEEAVAEFYDDGPTRPDGAPEHLCLARIDVPTAYCRWNPTREHSLAIGVSCGVALLDLAALGIDLEGGSIETSPAPRQDADGAGQPAPSPQSASQPAALAKKCNIGSPQQLSDPSHSVAGVTVMRTDASTVPLCAAFSPCGQYLAMGTRDGNVVVVDAREGGTRTQTFAADCSSAPAGTGVSALLWFRESKPSGESLLVAATAYGTKLELFRFRAQAFTCESVQKLWLQADGEAPTATTGRVLAVNPSGEFILASSTAGKSMYALHVADVAPDAHPQRQLYIDYGTELSVSHPICALDVIDEYLSTPNNLGKRMQLEMQVFMVQTETIQQYHVHVQQAYWTEAREAAWKQAGGVDPEAVPLTQEQKDVARRAREMEDAERAAYERQEAKRREEARAKEQAAAEARAAAAAKRQADAAAKVAKEHAEFEAQVEARAKAIEAQARARAQELAASRTADAGADTGLLSPGSLPSKGTHASGPAAGTAELLAMEQRLAATLATQQQNSAQHVCDTLAAAQQKRDKTTTKQQKMLLEAISTSINETLPEIMQEMLQNELHEASVGGGADSGAGMSELTSKVEGLCKAAITSTARQSQVVMAKAANAVTTTMQTPVHAAFRENFEQVLVPQFASAVSRMSDQIVAHIDTKLSRIQDQAKSSARAMQEQQKRMDAQLATMQRTIDTLNDRLASASSASAGSSSQGAAAEAAPAPDPKHEQRKKMRALVKKKEFENALHTALSLNDIIEVLWLCKQLNFQEVFARPLKVSQMIILCLVQQFGTSLVGVTDAQYDEAKRTGLMTAIMVLDERDDAIGSHAAGVLTQLKANVEAKMKQEEEQGNTSSRDTFVMMRGVIEQKLMNASNA